MVRAPKGPGWVALASASISGTSAAPSATIGAPGCTTQALASAKTIWSTESRPTTVNAGGGSTSSVVNNAIGSSPPTKASSDRNEAGSISTVAAKGAMEAG